MIENVVDICIYLRVSGSSYILLVLNVDYIPLASNDYDLLVEPKHMLSTRSNMKDLCKTNHVIGIKILCDMANGILSCLKEPMLRRN